MDGNHSRGAISEGRRNRPDRRARRTLAIRILSGLALLYAVVLVLAQFGILVAIASLGHADDPFRALWTFAVMKTVMIVVAAASFVWWRAIASAIAYAAALIYAFPLSPIIEGHLMDIPSPAGPELLLSLSALLSYAAAALAILARALDRPVARSLPSPESVD